MFRNRCYCCKQGTFKQGCFGPSENCLRCFHDRYSHRREIWDY